MQQLQQIGTVLSYIVVFIRTVLRALHVVALDEALDALLDISRLENTWRGIGIGILIIVIGIGIDMAMSGRDTCTFSLLDYVSLM